MALVEVGCWLLLPPQAALASSKEERGDPELSRVNKVGGRCLAFSVACSLLAAIG
jgi:hypothetical protein